MPCGQDSSRESLAAARWAAGEALRRGLPLRLVHAWEGLPENATEASLPGLRTPQYHVRRVLRGAADQISARHPQLHVAAQVRRQPGSALLDEAENAEPHTGPAAHALIHPVTRPAAPVPPD
ncbi:universal stress protein [Streptomyces sp. SID5643]|nr:universal stress protein [Streptomyces sp. SID5643]MZF87795.1 universal stress protein [Streptomyces sp. SID5643]